MKRRNAILLITDDNLLPPALHLWSRLCFLNDRDDTDILVVVPDKAIANFANANPNHIIPAGSLPMPATEYAGPTHVTAAACLRIVVPRYVRENYAKLLYLDIDVVVANASIFRVFDIDLDTPLAATRWHKRSFDPTKIVGGKIREKAFEFNRYFNSGVMLIDIDRYVEAEVDIKALRFLKEENGRSDLPDQTALNIAVGENWEELSPAMNFRAELLGTFFSEHFPPVIIHYVGGQKSWSSPSIPHPLRSEQLKWLVRNGHWRFWLKNIRMTRMVGALKRRRHGKAGKGLNYISRKNPLVKDYLAVRFVDDWNVRSAEAVDDLPVQEAVSA